MVYFGMGSIYEKAERADLGKAKIDMLEHEPEPNYSTNYFAGWATSYGTLNTENITTTLLTDEYIQANVPYVVNGSWNLVPWNFSNWQKAELAGLDARGTFCLLKYWFLLEVQFPSGNYCNASWDKMFCWPPTPKGTIVTPSCSEVWESQETNNLPYEIDGYASRYCTQNATWLKSNFTDCIDSFNQYIKLQEEELLRIIQHSLYVVPLISIVCLCLALLIFWYFRRCIFCDRVTLRRQLMFALLLRSLMLFIITEPYMLYRDKNYTKLNFVCKVILSIDLYAAVASINWMFLQGLYLNGRWTISMVASKNPFKTYFTIGWTVPMILIAMFLLLLQICHPLSSWTQITDMDEIYLFIGPMVLALAAHLLFLSKIMRVLCSRSQRITGVIERMMIMRAIRATMLLFPLVGINNLAFIYNPAGKWNKVFILCHTICGSSQGIFVAVLYCFATREVHSAIHSEFRRIREERRTKLQWGKTLQTPLAPPQVAQQPQQSDTVVQQVKRNCSQIEIQIHTPPTPPNSPRYNMSFSYPPPLPTIHEECFVVSTGMATEKYFVDEEQQHT